MVATTLGETIGSLLPAAVAVAISPIPIIAIVIVLGTARARVNGPAFAVGWIFGLGALLSGLNPKNLILAMSAGAAIAQADLSNGEDAIAIAVFVAIGSTTVVGAVLAYLVGGTRAADALGSVKTFMSANNAVIMAVLLLVIGAKVLGEGVAGLSA